MCGPMRGAVAGAIVFEGWARDLAEAEKLAASGEIRFEPNHHYGGVGPMTGVTTRNMAGLGGGKRTFRKPPFFAGHRSVGNVMRFGGNDREVVDRLKWIAAVAGPALGAAVRHRNGIPLKNVIARGLSMGDEMHMRNTACSSLIVRELAADLAETATKELPRIL